MAIDYDSTKLRCLPGVIALNPSLSSGFLSNSGWFNNLGPNANASGSQFRAAWYQLNPVTLSGTLFKIRFITKVPGIHNIVFDNQTPGNCEYSDSNALVVPNTHWTNGSVTASSLPLHLFAADTLFLCGDSTTIGVTPGLGQYLWNTGDTTALCFVNRSGWYSCTVLSGQCTLNDSVYVDLLGMRLVASADTLCAGSMLRLSASLTGPSLSGLFDGHRVYQASNPGPVGNQPRTYSIRFKTNQNSRQSFLSHGSLATGPGLVDLGMNLNVGYGAASGHCASINSGPSFFSTAHANTWGQAILMNEWNTLTYVMGSGGSMAFSDTRVFLNGNLISHGPAAVPSCGHNWGGWNYQTEPSPLFIGSGLGANPPFGGSALFDGDFDYISIWNRALSDQEVLNAQSTNPWGITNGLQHLYTFSGFGDQSELIDEVSQNNAYLVRGSAANPLSTVRYLWSTGDTTASIRVNPTQTTTYTLSVTDSYRTCTDSFTVFVTPNTLPTSLFPHDSLFVCGDSVNLSVGTGYDSYRWNLGDTLSNLTARRSGWFTCIATLGNCQVIDSLYVSLISDRIIQPTMPVCAGTTVTLQTIGNYSNSLRQGMIAHWPFNGQAGSTYGINRPNDYEQIGYTTDRFGLAGRAASLNGSNQYIQTNQPVLTTYGPYTISFWAQSNSGSDMEIFSQACPSDCQINGQFFHDFRVQLNAGQCQALGLSFKNESHFATANTITNDGLWHHYTMVVGSNSNHSYSNIEFYKDGQFMFVNCGHNWGGWQYMLPQVPTRIGAPVKGGTVPFQGNLDEIMVWNRALNRSEINDMLHEQPTRYLWSTGDTTPNITVNPLQTTTYYVTISNGIHSCLDSVTVNVLPIPANSNLFASDTLFHCGDSLVLDAGAGFDRYEWSTSDTTQTKTVRNIGWYRCSVFAGACSAEDSVFVSLIPEFLPFNDTTICTGSRLEINLMSYCYYPKTTEFIDSLYYDYDDFEGGSGSSDDWSERNGVDPQVVSNTSYKGNHSLYFNNGWGRNFEFQTEFGQPYGGYFSADYPFMSMAYKIPSGSFTTMLVHIAGIGWRGIAFTQGEQLGCYGPKVGSWNVNDTLVRNNQWHFKTINLHDQLQQSLGSGNYKIESIIFHDACTNTGTQGEMWIDEFMITRYKPNYYTSVSWSNGDTTSTITVSPTQTTTYYVTASNGIHSCTDSVTVNVLPNPLNPNLFASDTLFHCGDSLVINAGAGFDRYEWSTSDTTQTKSVRYTGWYRCRVYSGLCTVEDSVFVSIIPELIQFNDTSVCSGSQIELNVGTKILLSGSLGNGLLGYWPFNGNANDESGNGNNGTVNGANLTTDRFGRPNSSYQFSQGQFVDVGATILGQNPANLSYSVWVKGAGAIISKRQAVGTGWVTLTSSHFISDADGYVNRSCDIPESSNDWTHIVATKDGNLHSVYVNGLFFCSFTDNYTHYSFHPLLFGYHGAWNLGFNGKLDDIGIWNRSLTPNEVVRLFNLGNEHEILWSTGDTSASIAVSPSQTTTYYVTVSNRIHNCMDSVTVTVLPNPLNSNLFASDTLFHCGDSLILDAGSGFDRYEWSTSDTTQTKTVRYTGWYRCRVYSGLCTVEDSVFVSIHSNRINQRDTSVCIGNTLKLDIESFVLSNNNIEGYWPLRFNTLDVSSNLNHGTLNNFSSNPFDNSLLFDGIDDNVSIQVSKSPSSTFSFWLKATAMSGNETMIFNAGHYGSGPSLYLSCNGFNWNTWDACSNFLAPFPSTYFDGNFHHFVLVNSVDSGAKLFYDGVLIGTGAYRNASSNRILRLGSGGGGYPWGGYLSDFSVHNIEFDLNMVQRYFNSGRTTPTFYNQYLWSTGDTTASINVTPTQTTTYYVTISNGIHSCVDSVTVRVSPKIFIPNMEVCQGDTINVPVIASRLDSVAAISLALKYNDTAMTYVGYTGLRSDMVSTSSIGTAPGQVRMAWFGLTPLISNSADTLVYYQFVVHQPGSFGWNIQVQGDCELADLNLNILDYCFEGGSLSLVDTVTILSSSQGPYIVEVGDSIHLNVQSSGTLNQRWQIWNGNLSQWDNLQDNGAYQGTSTPSLTYHCLTYQRPFPKFRLELSNGCRSWYGPEMPISIKQRISVSLGSSVGCEGDTLEIPVIISGAREVGAVSLVFAFNANSLQLVDWINSAPQTASNQWFVNQVGNEIRLAWFSLQSANIPDGQPLGVLKVVGLGSSGLSWDLVTPGNCEFGDEEASSIPASFVYGSLTIHPLPSVQLTASAQAICPNGGVSVLSTVADPSYTYQWYLNGQPLTGSTGDSHLAGQSGLYQVKVTNTNGCSRWSTIQTISDHPLPNPVVQAVGSTMTCEQPVLLNASATQGNSLEFWWYLNGIPLSSTPSTQWTATQSGDYSVKAVDLSTLCEAWSPNVAININPNPSSTISYTGSTTFCQGDSLTLLANTNLGTAFQWTMNGQPITDATNPTFVARQQGTYAVVVSTALGCTSTSGSINVWVQNCNAINGRLSYNNTLRTSLRNTKILFQDSAGSILDSTTTNNAGDYSFSGYSNGFYRVKAAPSLTWGGVNATDALAIVRHYTNYVLLQGFRLQAADVNGSNNVNNTDALLITRRYSNLVPGFNVGAWLSENPIVQANGQTITQNIQTLCYGDVNGSYNPVQTRLAPKINLVELGTQSTPNNCFHLPIYSLDNQELGAISLAMVLPKGTRVLKVNSKIPEGIMEYGQWEDELRIGWFTQNQFAVKEGEILFEIELCMDGDTKEFGPSDIEVRGLSELANFWAIPYDMARLGVPSVKIWNKSSEDLIIWPNPTNENARLRLTTSEPVLSYSLRVLDAVGREVYQANPSIVKIGDVQELVLPSAEWAKGIYAVQTNWTTLNGLNKSKTVMLRRE